jgi:hypothetical protein
MVFQNRSVILIITQHRREGVAGQQGTFCGSLEGTWLWLWRWWNNDRKKEWPRKRHFPGVLPVISGQLNLSFLHVFLAVIGGSLLFKKLTSNSCDGNVRLVRPFDSLIHSIAHEGTWIDSTPRGTGFLFVHEFDLLFFVRFFDASFRSCYVCNNNVA